MNTLAMFAPESEYGHLEDLEGQTVVISKARIEESKQYGRCAIFALEGNDKKEYITFARFVVSAIENAIRANALPVTAVFTQVRGKGGRRVWIIENSENT